jgi:hypothetical protein
MPKDICTWIEFSIDSNFTSMIIDSSFGSFCVVADSKKSDGLLFQSKSRIALNRLFDDKRVKNAEPKDYPYFVELGRQEFIHLMIIFAKDISYENFDKKIPDKEVISSRFSR